MNATLQDCKAAGAAAALVLALVVVGCAPSGQTPSGSSMDQQDEQQTGIPPAAESPAPRTEDRRAPEPAPRASRSERTAPKPARETIRKTVPSGTSLHVSLETNLATDVNVAGDHFEATLTEPVIIDNLQVIPAGSMVSGVLSDVRPAKKMSGGASMTLSFKELRLPNGYRATLSASLTSQGAKTGKKSGAIIGGSAAGGAVLGKVLGKSTKDAVIGSVIGGAIGAGVAASQDKDVRVPAGTALVVMTEQPLQIPVKVKVEG